MARSAKRRREKVPAGATSVVDEVMEQIAFAIASGRHAAGDRLPSVRAIAAAYRINPSTVQVVLARLRAEGFVEVRPGVGLLVRDIEQYGGINTWRYIFRFAQRLPERSTKIFADILATRRILVLEAARLIAAAPGQYDPRPVRRAVERLEMVVAHDAADVAELARAELQATRVMMLQVGQTVVLALCNSIGEILLEVPAVMQAMYAEPAVSLTVWHGLLDRWERATLSEADIVQGESVIRQLDARSVERFRQLVTRASLEPVTPAHPLSRTP